MNYVPRQAHGINSLFKYKPGRQQFIYLPWTHFAQTRSSRLKFSLSCIYTNTQMTSQYLLNFDQDFFLKNKMHFNFGTCPHRQRVGSTVFEEDTQEPKSLENQEKLKGSFSQIMNLVRGGTSLRTHLQQRDRSIYPVPMSSNFAEYVSCPIFILSTESVVD